MKQIVKPASAAPGTSSRPDGLMKQEVASTHSSGFSFALQAFVHKEKNTHTPVVLYQLWMGPLAKQKGFCSNGRKMLGRCGSKLSKDTFEVSKTVEEQHHKPYESFFLKQWKGGIRQSTLTQHLLRGTLSIVLPASASNPSIIKLPVLLFSLRAQVRLLPPSTLSL